MALVKTLPKKLALSHGRSPFFLSQSVARRRLPMIGNFLEPHKKTMRLESCLGWLNQSSESYKRRGNSHTKLSKIPAPINQPPLESFKRCKNTPRTIRIEAGLLANIFANTCISALLSFCEPRIYRWVLERYATSLMENNPPQKSAPNKSHLNPKKTNFL